MFDDGVCFVSTTGMKAGTCTLFGRIDAVDVIESGQPNSGASSLPSAHCGIPSHAL